MQQPTKLTVVSFLWVAMDTLDASNIRASCTYQKRPVVTMAWSPRLLGSGTLSYTALLHLLLQQAAVGTLRGSACWEGELQGALRMITWTAEDRIISMSLRCFWMAINVCCHSEIYEQISCFSPHCTLTLIRFGSCFLIYWNHSAPRGKGVLPPPTS